MTDYCVSCGDASASDSEGEYLEFSAESDGRTFYIERFVCSECLGRS